MNISGTKTGGLSFASVIPTTKRVLALRPPTSIARTVKWYDCLVSRSSPPTRKICPSGLISNLHVTIVHCQPHKLHASSRVVTMYYLNCKVLSLTITVTPYYNSRVIIVSSDQSILVDISIVAKISISCLKRKIVSIISYVYKHSKAHIDNSE